MKTKNIDEITNFFEDKNGIHIINLIYSVSKIQFQMNLLLYFRICE